MAANLEEHHLPNRLDGQKHESSEMSKDIDTELGVERKKDAVSIPGTSEPVNSFWQKLVNLGVELRGLEPIPLELRTDENYVNILTLFSKTSMGLLP